MCNSSTQLNASTAFYRMPLQQQPPTALHDDDAEVVGDDGRAREVVLHRVDVHLVPQLRLCEALHLRGIPCT